MKLIKHLINLLFFTFGGYRPITGPLRVHWDVIEKCNSRCRACQRWKLPPKGDDLSFEEGCNLLRQLAECGLMSISFSGNEPLLREDIFDLMKYAKDLKLNVSLNTNGLLVDKNGAEKICQLKINTVVLSLDGPDPEINDYLRGIPGAFEKTLEVLKLFKEARQKYKTRLKITVNIVANHKNVGRLLETVKLCREKGFDSALIQPLHQVKEALEAKPELNFNLKDLGLLTQQIDRIKREYHDFLPVMDDYFDQFVTFYQTPNLLYKYRCTAAYLILDIRSNGDLVPCPTGFKKLGNIREKSFKEIWYSKEADLIRREIKNNQHPICWFACIQPVNLLIFYLKTLRFHKFCNFRLLRHLIFKIK